MFYVYIIVFVFAAVFGFVYGKKTHLRQMAEILHQLGMPLDKVSELSERVRTYKKTVRQAKKETREAYKKLLVESQLEKMKKEVDKNG